MTSPKYEIAIIGGGNLGTAIAEGLSERQAEKTEESEDVEDVSDKSPRFALEEDEDKGGARRGAGGAAGGGGKAQPKRRVPGPGAGGRRPAQKR